MFTVKICNPGDTKYFETESIHHEVIDAGETLRFSAAGREHWWMLDDPRHGSSSDPHGIEKAERIYVMNESGKTVDIFRAPALVAGGRCGSTA
ncbi:hypothetical protein NLU14_08655 [Marinobacter sp. 71-i]|uniref:Uncharacterized protein n=1 Tax=Marinobacter iranensis TaxID=2962607 RepID=A0ABT5Y9E3_9GAMM|nr:hypothetical protein [Marinobacter iranensis]MDF0750299.1 hypothetical protein [Marinobacter iranensis]